MAIENKAPGKDVSEEDLREKFPLAAKKDSNHKSSFEVNGIEFGGEKYLFLQVQTWLK